MSRKKRDPYGSPLRAGWSTTLRGDGPFISFYCRGNTSSRHDKWRIGSVSPSVVNGDLYWSESFSGYADSSRDVMFGVYPPISQHLVGNEWVSMESLAQASVTSSPDLRIAWMLQCGKCGFSRKIAQPRLSYPILSVLIRLRGADGVLELPVQEFAKRLDALP